MEISQENARQVIGQMDRYIRTELLEEGKISKGQLWENIYIRQQIKERKAGGSFSLEDHIRAVVYAMLSSSIKWKRVEKYIDPDTKRILCVDDIFCNYDAKRLLACRPEELRDAIKGIKCAGRSTLRQMEALLTVIIPRLAAIEKEYGIIDAYYQKFIEIDGTLKILVTILAASESSEKMAQMDIALVCEYLRNIGHDLPKPDRHIRRILGRDRLAFSDKKEVPPFEAFAIVVKLAELAGKSPAETDYILWLYCASGYGEICAKDTRCGQCAVNTICEGAIGK